MAQKDATECTMMMGEIATMQEDSIAIVVVIAPSEEEAQKYAEKVLTPYYTGYPQRMGFYYMRPILLSPVTKTIFLYTRENGQISDQSVVGFCKIASEPGSCIYFPCCKPSDRGDYCRHGNCRSCNKRRCKPEPNGTISIDNMPCGDGTGGDCCD